jgi:hypothetical protein
MGRTGRDYLSRVRNLFGDGTDGRNGAFLLNAANVHRTTALDQLFGGMTGGDWFWFSDSVKTAGRVFNYSGLEVATFE